MKSSALSTEPSVHRLREQRLLEHVQRLLSEDRLRLETWAGPRAVTTLIRDVSHSDRAMDLKRRMADLGVYDRDLQGRMPVGEMVEVTLSQKRFFVFRQTVGRLRVLCVSPTDALIKGEPPEPLDAAETQRLLGGLPPSLGGVPQTVVLMSTSGFSPDARELAERSGGRTVLLVEPDGAGGWDVHAPPEAKALADLFDPESDEEKHQRVREAIDDAKIDLLTSGISVERLASRTKVPASIVEAELRAYARANPGLAARRLDGQFVLFREGPSSAASAANVANGMAAGGSSMPWIDRMKALFSRKGDDEKKLAFLSERRAALGVQRDRSYEELGALEQQEEQLRQQFKDATGSITKKRVTSQLLQLRKDLERRQQLLAVLNQQINVVSTHLHNLELVAQGASANLPDTEEMTADAVKAEEVLAELEANAEIAGSVHLSAGAGGLTSEEQALYEELEAELKGEKAKAAQEGGAAGQTTTGEKPKTAEPSRQRDPSAPPPIPTRTKRGEAEPG
jgi:hypothetical protein